MNPETSSSPGALPAELSAQLFSNMVMQYASMALMFMGQSPHPETGEKVTDLDAAQMFISQLEMLQAKTKGNLTVPEEAILRQGLMTTRLAFVDALQKSEKAPETIPGPDRGTTIPPSSPDPGLAPEAEPNAAAAAEADERKKFVKKY